MIDLTSDLDVLAATLWGEARGEGSRGIAAVASVIANRVAHSEGRLQFGDGTFKGACLALYQFSCWNHDDPNRAKLLALDLASAPVCVWTAQQALAGALDDPTGGALYYKVSTLAWPHDWGRETPPTCTIGHHSFYKF